MSVARPPIMANTIGRQRFYAYAAARDIIRRREAEAEGINAWELHRNDKPLNRDRFRKFIPGVYVRDGVKLSRDKQLAIIAKEVPNGVLCLQSALWHWSAALTRPDKFWMMVPTGTWIPKGLDDHVRFVRCAPSLHAAGLEVFHVEGVEVQCYGFERSIVECFRYRKKIGEDVGPRALIGALDGFTTREEDLIEWAQRLRVERIVRSYVAAWRRRDRFRELYPDDWGDWDEPEEQPLDDEDPPPRKRGRPPVRKDPLPGILEEFRKQRRLPEWVLKRAEKPPRRDDDDPEDSGDLPF